MNRLLAFFVTAFALGAVACGPIITFPGGELSGNVRALPDRWDFTNDVDTVQLETRPEDPYSVNIWCVAADSKLFVAGSRSSTWTQNVAADGRVRLRVEGDLYELEAVEVTEEEDFDAFVAGAKAKYDFEPDPEQRATSILFRLEPR